MTVDVMLPYYGDVDQMKLAAQSVLNQQYQDWRLIVIDDGYPDPEPRRWFSEITDSRVTYMRNEENLGANGNYRKALGLVEAPYVVIMGADDIMLPNYLGVVVSAFEEYPKADVVQPGVQVIDEKGIACTPLVDAVKKVYAPKTSERIELKGEAMATSLVRADWAYFPSLAWKSETVTRIGFTEGLDVVQDLALLLDIAAEHGSMVIDPVLAFLYRRHSASDSSVRALDGRRFDEERHFFESQAERFAALGWKKAARAASFHTTSRLNAATLILKSVGKGKFDSLPRLAKHIVG
ncbi:glycosyltransferase [Arthrobacter bambusae]|jgi:glycosyltransferase involved in cell wall biosynthesis|uniref:glycosyltransferase family 2 protein n=1 Tax=Arthrobacter TaxID=1663 RepID=UPI000990DE16|nr:MULTISPECIES: glycosyltransferase [Arthrobacter]MCI0142230.1 glycosyltransferase [Arthrobacter bambusae]MDQ0209797.1 glycosyltransferase involved in cell wall biosynthesis [Arthrobacter bambusae]MDQ0233877.1 glycosyltransferase involved in cell wall biosynthesis [Arthrobacter bambusae]OOP60109.1 glycosyl transferase family 2 [Arthrobacter sp. SRS-W-1-2016]UYY80369.1 glycosyltransferase [Arthrobacter sp. YA7-1]